MYAIQVLDLLSRTPDIEILDGAGAGRAGVILCLDGRFRARRGRGTVTAVLDLGHLYGRRGYGGAEWLARHWRTASAAHRSGHLLAPSESVRSGLVRHLGVPEGRVTVVAAIPRPEFRRPPRQQVDELRRRWGLPARYFVFVGARGRRKNLGLLARAWTRAAGALGPEVGLVLAGPGGGGVPGARDVGWVETGHLPALIAGAVAWLGPGRYEGSAVGALEAMACGTPALVSGTGAQARAVGAGGLVLGPDDDERWAGAMVAVARDAGLRSRLGAAGLEAAAAVRASDPGPGPLAAALWAAAAAGR